MSLSLCLIVKNEEQYLGRCLESLYKYVDEIIITDTGSTDSTLDIARKYTDKIYHFDWIDDFAAARNFCQSHATGDFVLWMDADEWFLEKDISILRKHVEANPRYDFFSITIIHLQNGIELKKEQKLKIMKNNNKYHWMWKIHEIVDTIKPFDVYGQGTYCPDIYFFHTFKTKDKFWANIDYFKAHFEREKTNSTVSMRLLNYYIGYGERDSIVPLLKEIPYIHWRFINEFIKIGAALEKNKYYEEQKILNQLIKKSLVLSKRLGRSR